MANLREKLAEHITAMREDIGGFVKKNADKVISEVTVRQLYGGMRGVKGLVCNTSLVEPDKGLIIRGRPIKELTNCLPEEVFYLLCVGEIPDKQALTSLQEDLKFRSEVPGYVWDVLKAMPKDSHPMAMFDTAILVMQHESIFKQKYDAGLRKTDFWEVTLDDALSLIAKLPAIAAYVYRLRFDKGPRIPSNSDLDWAADYAYMLGTDDPTGEFANLMRLYMVLHSDHEGGNVSAFTCSVVSSALSDLYYSVSAGLNGLAGPLHGLANQECLKFVLSIQEQYKGVPSDDELKKFVWATLNSGRVIPGYGHAVLRVTDPRFDAFMDFGKRVCPDDEVFQIVDRLFALVPDILKEHGKAKNPWPNVDAGSGGLLFHFGLTMFDYYTVLFSVSRALGMCAQQIINRGLMAPIIRPKSVLHEWAKEAVGA